MKLVAFRSFLKAPKKGYCQGIQHNIVKTVRNFYTLFLMYATSACSLIGERPDYGQSARSEHSVLNYAPHITTNCCVTGTKGLPVEGSGMTAKRRVLIQT
jgi:hypothetical protein